MNWNIKSKIIYATSFAFTTTNIFLYLTVLTFTSCSNKIPEENVAIVNSKTAVKTVAVEQVEYAKDVNATGRLAYNNEYKLSFKTGGIVQAIYVKEGQYVKAGTLLATLKLDEINSQTTQIDNAYKKAQRDFERVQALYNDSVATLEQLQDAETQLENTRLNLNAARFNQKYSKIVAPTRGIVQKIMIQENELAAPGHQVVVFGAKNAGKVLITNISDADVVRINLGDPALLSFDPYPETVFKGSVSEISGMSNPTTGTYEIKILINDTDNHLKPGFIGNAKIVPTKTKNLAQIPVEALNSANKKTGNIYKVKNGLAIKQKVKIENFTNDKILVSKGLTGNDTIVSIGHHSFMGDSIHVTMLN